MGTFGYRLRQEREANKFSREEIAQKLNVSYWTIAKYELDERKPDIDTLLQLANIFDVSMDYLGGKTPLKTPLAPTVKVPLLGTIRAGLPLLAEENCHYEVEVPSDLRADFALRVTGDSMSYVGICDGDIAVMRQGNTASHGMIVAAGIEDGDWQATLKFYIEERGQRLLRAANPDYSDIILNGHYKIIGYVVQILKEPPSLNNYRQFLTRNITDTKWQNVIMTAAKHGLSAEQIENMIDIFSVMARMK